MRVQFAEIESARRLPRDLENATVRVERSQCERPRVKPISRLAEDAHAVDDCGYALEPRAYGAGAVIAAGVSEIGRPGREQSRGERPHAQGQHAPAVCT